MSANGYLFLAAVSWLVGVCLLVTVVYPSLVRRLREAVIAARINRAVLLPDDSDAQEFRVLQLRALIYDGAGGIQNVATRLSKLRELYLAMDHRGRRATFSENDVSRYGRRCLQELAQIVRREIDHLRPTLRLDGPIIAASEILQYVANRDLETRLQPRVHKASEVEAHFRTNPVTVEQIGELLEALCYGLLYRKGAPPALEVDDAALLTDIVRIEKRFRSFVGVRLNASQSMRDYFALLREALGEEAAQRALERGKREGADEGTDTGAADWLLDYLHLDELKQLLQRRWDSFSTVLPSRKRVNEVFDGLAPIRNRLAHGRRLSSTERRMGRAACLEMENWLEASRNQAPPVAEVWARSRR
jgi:hypothetical protein